MSRQPNFGHLRPFQESSSKPSSTDSNRRGGGRRRGAMVGEASKRNAIAHAGHPGVQDDRSSSKCRKGAALVLIALLLPIIVGMVAFAVDVGLMTLLRSQIQNAVDAGTLAASLSLRQDPSAIEDARAAAEEFVQLNRVGTNVTVAANAISVETGQWDEATKTFVATTANPNAVRVFATQDNEPHLFGGIFGHTTFGAPASAIATGAGNSLDIMMVLDLSGSMAHQGRIQALRNAAPIFVDIIDELGGDDLIGVMGLAADPGDTSPSHDLYASGLHPTDDHYVGVMERRLTDNYSSLRNSTLGASNLTANKYNGWTGTGAALGDAAHYLENGAEARGSAQNIIVLLSDGNANRPSGSGPEYARTMASYAAGLGVKVYTISLGNRADVGLMGDIAKITGAEHFDATGSGEETLTSRLREAFEDIAAAIKRTQLVQ